MKIVGLNIKIAALARHYLETFASPLARKFVLHSPDVVNRIWAEIDRVRAETYEHWHIGYSKKIPEYFVAISAALSRFTFQCHQQIEQRLAKNIQNSSGADGAMLGEYFNEAQAEFDGLSKIWPVSVMRVEKELNFIVDVAIAILDVCPLSGCEPV
jgi:hypothetical protein